jgi:hypothetical protein
VTGKVFRATGQGLQRHDTAKSEAGLRTLPLPRFAIDVLTERRQVPFLGEQQMIFASTAGTLRDPNNFNKQWRQVRDGLEAAHVTTHSFRKSLATLIDDEGMSAALPRALARSRGRLTLDPMLSDVAALGRRSFDRRISCPCEFSCCRPATGSSGHPSGACSSSATPTRQQQSCSSRHCLPPPHRRRRHGPTDTALETCGIYGH